MEAFFGWGERIYCRKTINIKGGQIDFVSALNLITLETMCSASGMYS